MSDRQARTSRRLTRRALLQRTLFVGLLPLLPASTRAQGALDPSDPSAVAVGYTTDHRKVDRKRWSKKARENAEAPQRCGTCAMRNADGGCELFGGRRVTENGWCNAWTAR